MNQCKSCGSLFQSTLTSCPICHTSLIPTPSKKTDDFTQKYNPLAGNVELVRLKSRLLTVILAFTLGLFGAPFFYLGFMTRALFILALNVLIFFLAIIVPNLFGIPWMIVFAASNLMTGFFYWFNLDAKDARGDFLQ